MKKYSRKHGQMLLKSYASGNGSISFVWVSENTPNGECLSEAVTESDVSEWLLLPENRHFYNWVILDLSIRAKNNIPHQICLYKTVERPFGSSRKLTFEGKTYKYSEHGDRDGSFHPSNVDFYLINSAGNWSKKPVKNMDIILALCFFLDNEEVIEANGYQTKEMR